MKREEKERTGEERQFYWAVFSVAHKGCPFIGMSTALSTTITPVFFDIFRFEKPSERIDVCLDVDTYIELADFQELSKPFAENIELIDFYPDVDSNHTLIIATVRDEMVNKVVAEINKIPPIYAKGGYEYVTIRALVNYESWREVVEKIETKLDSFGEVTLERLGRVRNTNEFRLLRLEMQTIEAPISCLSHEENSILSTAIAYGFYEQPRRITLAELAQKMNMPTATLHQKLRKIEERLLTRATQRDVFSWQR